MPEGAQDGTWDEAQGLPQADGWQLIGETATSPQDSEAASAAQDEVRNWASQTKSKPYLCGDDENERRQAGSEDDVAGQQQRRKSTPGLIFTNEYGEQVEDSTWDDRGDKWSRSPEGSGSEYETAEEWGDCGQGGGWVSADDELSEGLVGGPDGVTNVREILTKSDIQQRNDSAEGELSKKQTFCTDVYKAFCETQGVAYKTGFWSETQGQGVFDSESLVESQGRGAFDSDPFAEAQGGGVFDSDPFAETHREGVFDLDYLVETKFANKGGVSEHEDLDPGDGRCGWDGNPFATIFSPVSSASNITSCQVSSSDLESSLTQENSASTCGTTAEGIKDVNIPRIHKEPENSDMSEDEAANRRFGKLYQELDTEKEEVLDSVW